MKKMINKSHIEGLLYQSTLKAGVYGEKAKNPGGNYIRGSIDVQVSEDNIVSIDFFESEITKKGEKNGKYNTLLTLMNSPSVVDNGADAAIKVRIDSAVDLNDWYPKGSDQLVSNIRNMNGFVHVVDKITPSATFETDMLIVSTTDEMVKNASGDMEPSGAIIVSGYIFNFANHIMPVRFTVEKPSGVKYFRNLDQNTFTKVWGDIVTQTTKTTKVEKSAFDEDKVVEYTSTHKKYVIAGAASEPYMFGDANVLTGDEVKAALATREIYLADLKSRTPAKVEAPQKNNIANASNMSFNF